MVSLVDKLEWVSIYGRKQCRRLFWRVRAAVKKTVKANTGHKRRQLMFHYDPSSYALNFDDGSSTTGGLGKSGFVKQANLGESKITIWVYVVWLEAY